MVSADIGYLLFVEILGMTAYPGHPFTGNIIQDLVLFFFIPSVFIIFIVYILTARMMKENPKLRLLLGITFYLFIVFSPYHLYSMFAYLAGPYFLFMLLILGVLYFFIGHFKKGEEIQRGAGSAPEEKTGFLSKRKALEFEREQLEHDISSLKKEIAENKEQIEKINKSSDANKSEGIAILRQTISNLEKQKRDSEKKLRETEEKLRRLI